MKVVSYNVNGIRAAIKKGFLTWLEELNADVVCLQEIKADASVFPKEDIEKVGYHVEIHPAEKKGYSGVAILSKQVPDSVKVGADIDYMDKEGRILQANFGDVSVVSLYLPSGTNDDRLSFKFRFMDDFNVYIENLLKEYPNLIVCGDYNICHHAIDIHDPVRNKKVSGFLPEERAWLTEFVDEKFVDSFRIKHPDEPDHYSWWSYRANSRANNKGWRIDYCMVSLSLLDKIEQAGVMPSAVHSDHCPVWVDIEA